MSLSNRVRGTKYAAKQSFQPSLIQTVKVTAAVLVGLILVNPSLAQQAAAPSPASTPAQELRRQDERERNQREERERAPDVRLTPAAPPLTTLLPIEASCFVIKQVVLKTTAAENPQLVDQFAWIIDKLAGPDNGDAPQGRCLGSEGISLLLKRGQDALVARGFVTSRIVAEPQDLAQGILQLTLLPGRIRAVRFATDADPRGTKWNAVPSKPGDILNLRDIEQALENFKRLPTAEADIQIEPAEERDGQAARPGQSDLVIRYKQAFPFRVSLSLDDGGSKATGKYQGGVTLSYDHFLTLNDLLYINLNNNLGGEGAGLKRGSSGNTVHYSVPFGYWLLATTDAPLDVKQALIQMAGGAIGAVAGGAAGVASALTLTSQNYLTHTDIRNRDKKLKGCQANGDTTCEVKVLKDYDLLSAKNTGAINYNSVLSETALQAEKIQLERLINDPTISAESKAQAQRNINELSAAINVIQKSPVLKDAAQLGLVVADVVLLGQLAAAKVLTSTVVREYVLSKTGKEITPDAATVIANNFYREGAAVEYGGSRVITNPNEAVFWSGRTGNVGGVDAAKTIADQYKGRTLEQLIETRQITMPMYDPNVPASVQAWQSISTELAKNASGEVRAVLGAQMRPQSIWETI